MDVFSVWRNDGNGTSEWLVVSGVDDSDSQLTVWNSDNWWLVGVGFFEGWFGGGEGSDGFLGRFLDVSKDSSSSVEGDLFGLEGDVLEDNDTEVLVGDTWVTTNKDIFVGFVFSQGGEFSIRFEALDEESDLVWLRVLEHSESFDGESTFQLWGFVESEWFPVVIASGGIPLEVGGGTLEWNDSSGIVARAEGGGWGGFLEWGQEGVVVGISGDLDEVTIDGVVHTLPWGGGGVEFDGIGLLDFSGTGGGGNLRDQWVGGLQWVGQGDLSPLHLDGGSDIGGGTSDWEGFWEETESGVFLEEFLQGFLGTFNSEGDLGVFLGGIEETDVVEVLDVQESDGGVGVTSWDGDGSLVANFSVSVGVEGDTETLVGAAWVIETSGGLEGEGVNLSIEVNWETWEGSEGINWKWEEVAVVVGSQFG